MRRLSIQRLGRFLLALLAVGGCLGILLADPVPTAEDVLKLVDAGVHAMLVGESLIKSESIENKIADLRGTTESVNNS